MIMVRRTYGIDGKHNELISNGTEPLMIDTRSGLDGLKVSRIWMVDVVRRLMKVEGSSVVNCNPINPRRILYDENESQSYSSDSEFTLILRVN